MNKKSTKKENVKKPYVTFVKVFWGVFLFGLITLIGIFGLSALGLLGPMPPLEQLENPKTNLATQIISSDGMVLGKFYFNDNRTPISFEELPKNIVDALIATEDERYFDHSGIDWRGFLRAVFYLGKKGGASTITQQLARQLSDGFFGNQSYKKLKNGLQGQLERSYTKKEIIAHVP